VAVATTVATTFTPRHADAHVGGTFSPGALTHGFQIAFYVLAALAAAGALISVVMLESRPARLQLTSAAFELEEA
jgi:hypothetical protein